MKTILTSAYLLICTSVFAQTQEEEWPPEIQRNPDFIEIRYHLLSKPEYYNRGEQLSMRRMRDMMQGNAEAYGLMIKERNKNLVRMERI